MVTRLPGHYHKQFRVTTSLPTGKTVKSDDGMPLQEWSRTGDLLPHEVVDRVLKHTENVMAMARSDRAKTAAETRRESEAARP